MVKMKNPEEPVLVPPIELYDYDEFRELARRAAILTYYPDYFVSPFMDEQKKMKRLTLHAVGVIVNGLPMTFRFVVNGDDLLDTSKTWADQTDEVDRFLSGVVEELEREGMLVRGTPESGPSLGEGLLMRP
ncbi:MAG: hypothetical protein JSW61_02665 [Candidatus Thorarchaeota archaeon]|nr:MAG: hypothetical protein JSW61_02665 [Candidatus Thorarchaeota archaeon]